MSSETLAAGGRVRRAELSAINVLFCLMIVYFHVASQSLADLDPMYPPFAAVLVLQRLASIAVPGFFFLSGLKMTLSPPRKTVSAYYLDRAKRLLGPYLLAAAVYYPVLVGLGWYTFSLPQFFQMVLLGSLSAQFYFIVALAQFTLLAPLFRRLTERYSAVILLPPALMITQISGPFFTSLAQRFPDSFLPSCTGLVCTNFLFYYLAGCFAGANYESFLALVKKNQPLLLPLALLSACAAQIACVLHYSGRTSIPYLNSLNLLYYISGVLALFTLPVRIPGGAVGWLVKRVDRASYLIYLYHCLVIVLFNLRAAGWGLTSNSAQLFGRALVTYGLTVGGCVAWQELWRRLSHQNKEKHR